MPSWINMDLFHESVELLKEQDVQYAEKISYHQMCRWNSGMFYKHPALQNYRWYWRVEPNVHFFCDVDYDVFRWMEDHNKTYGFTINLYDSPQSVTTLWPETLKFLASDDHSRYLHKNNAMDWLTDSKRREQHNLLANGYSTCHFWSNFEVGDMDFWRSRPYEEYFQHLDRSGGFFYERWGDAPVHSIALGMFADKSKIHWYVGHAVHHFRAWHILTSHLSGSAISATNTSPSSTVPRLPNARAVSPAGLLTARPGSTRKTAGQIGSSLSAWIEKRGDRS